MIVGPAVGGLVRCKCGVFLKASQKRCKACAVDYLRQFETDRFESQIQNEPIVLDFSEEEIKRWQEMTPRSLPKVPRKVKPWDESVWRRQERMRLYAGIALTLVVMAVATLVLLYG